jgi:hypothetical protein
VLTGRYLGPQARGPSPLARVLEIASGTFRRVPWRFPDVADVFISGLARRMRHTQRAYRQHEKLAASASSRPASPTSSTTPPQRPAGRQKELRERRPEAQLLALEHDERISPDARDALASLQRETSRGATHLDRSPERRGGRARGMARRPGPRRGAWDLARRWPPAAWAWNDWRASPRSLGSVARRRPGVARDDAGRSGPGRRGVGERGPHLGARRGDEGVHLHGPGERARRSTSSRAWRTPSPSSGTSCGASRCAEYEEYLPKVPGHGGELYQVWTNLIDNAADAVDGRGRITCKGIQDGDSVAVEVVDDGPGIPREVQGAASSSPSSRRRR